MKTYTARSPLDLVALVPFLIGFHPEDSVVLLTFGSAEPFHARVDLPDNLAEQQDVAAMLHRVCREHEVPLAAVLLYSDDAAASAAMGERLLQLLTNDGVRVVDVLRVEEGEYFDCLDPSGSGVAYDLSTHPFTASRVFEGRYAHESRGALADTLVGTDEDDRDEVLLAAELFAEQVVVAEEPLGWLADLLAGLDAAPRRLEPWEAGRVLVLLSEELQRHFAWVSIDHENASRQVELWRGLVRRAPDHLLPAPAALLAFAAWQAGDGALAWCAVDRCVSVDPDHPLAELVADLLTSAVPPSTWRWPQAG